MTNDGRDVIQSIERGFAVLSAFDDKMPNPSLAELAGATGLSRPTVRRILLTLQKLGFVVGAQSRWSLTPRVLSIGQHYSASHTLVERVAPRLLEIAQVTGESASLGVLDDLDVVYAARVPGRRIMSLNVSVGTRVPAYATAMGRVLLAWAPPGRVAEVIARIDFGAVPSSSVRSGAELTETLAQVRGAGYSLAVGELEVGLIALSVPVRDPSQNVIGALACSTSTARSTAEDFLAVALGPMSAAARTLAEDLGLRP